MKYLRESSLVLYRALNMEPRENKWLNSRAVRSRPLASDRYKLLFGTSTLEDSAFLGVTL